MLLFPNAKINLGLHIVAKRPDGYHELETLFYPIELCDAVEITPAETSSFHLSGIALEGDPGDNLVVKAYRLLSQHTPLPALSIFLHKVIPSGAGLGGGSSDGAFALQAFNQFAQKPVSSELLQRLAASLGADCPFFLYNKPLIARGIGNQFSPASCSLKGYHILLIKPPIHVGTAEAYRQVKPALPNYSLEELLKQPVHYWRNTLQNDFEKSIFQQHPLLDTIKAKLYELGADYAAMSGSGSALFGLFSSTLPVDIESHFKHCFLWQGACQI